MVTTRYAQSGEVNIAYQVVGSGERDLVYVPGWVSNIEVMWEDPGLARFLNRLASFSRLITFDKRGTGLSDSVPLEHLPTLEVRMDDLRAVMDAVGSERAVLFGHSEGGAMCMLFAATYPDRCDSLILTGSYATKVRSDDYPWAPSTEDRLAEIEALEQAWGDPEIFSYLVPSRADDQVFQAWLHKYQRLSASPRAAGALMRMNSMIDLTAILPSIRVPTLLLYRVDDLDVNIEEGRYLASKIPDARLVELPGADHAFWGGDTELLLEEIEEFITGHRVVGGPERVLATVLFTDIVDSTMRAAALGDSAWRDLLDRHHATVRAELARWRGKEIATAGDGFFATFDGPARAIRCARAVADGVGSLGIAVRCGLHTGEVETRGHDVSGLAVHIGARIAGLADAGEVLVSRTVKDLVAGAGFEFRDRGSHELKGVPDRWDVYEVLT
ncbi:MAG TPA: adenylate/guanylate cyclase domain-containing protein [Acidimicrobiia bacterium]|nr:adenylate/guanylate cyclase domain-containing protein [Acidimicrobiia bacterium]